MLPRFLLLFLLPLTALHAGTGHPEGVPERFTRFEIKTFRELDIAPDKHKGRSIAYEGRYLGYKTNWPPYIEKSGFEPDDDIILLVNKWSLPVIADRDDKDVMDLLPALKKTQRVMVYGRIKAFRKEPEWTGFPHYYMQLEYLAVITADDRERKGSQEGEADKDRGEPGRHDNRPVPPWKR